MATNLNPGADATLVQAATNAAMANVPLDQSKAYEQLAAGYAKFADGMVSMYAPIAKAVGEAAAPLVEKVKEKVGENLQELWLNINKHFKDDYVNEELVLSEKFTYEVPDLSGAEIGVENADVKAFQLKYLEFYGEDALKYGADGRLGTETIAAIEKLRKDQEEASKTNTVIKPNGTYLFDNGQGQTNKISLTGPDEYLQQLKDENANAEAMFANNKMSKKDKDDLISANLAKAQNAKNSARAFSKEQVRIMNLINNDNFNPMASGAMGMDFVNAAIERGRSTADGSRVVRGHDDDGNIALIWIDKYGRAKIDPTTGKSWVVSQGQMKKFIVEKDTESEVSVTKTVTTDQQALGKSGIKFNGQEVMNNITKMVSNEKTFLHMINTSIADNTGTFREHVYGAKKDENGNWVFDPTKLSQEIYSQLSMLGSQFDNDTDGDVDKDDFVSDENKAALANYLTSYNPTSVNAFASFMKDTAEGYHAQGAGMIKPANEELMGEDGRGGGKKKTDENDGGGEITTKTRQDFSNVSTAEIDKIGSSWAFSGTDVDTKFLLNEGSGTAVVSVFNDKYNKYGFYAKKNDGASNPKLTNELSAGYKYERDGEGLIRVYYRPPADGPVYNKEKNFYTYGNSDYDYNGKGAYIDVLHDSWTDGRRWKNERYLEGFMKTMFDKQKEYWGQEVNADDGSIIY